MPKRLLILLIVASAAIAACGGGGGSTTTTPTGPLFSPTPNPKVTKATVEVTAFGTPVPKIPVEISTPRSTSSPRPGKPFDTVTTGMRGLAHFKNLDPNQTYCWVAVLGPGREASTCANWQIWQTVTVMVGN